VSTQSLVEKVRQVRSELPTLRGVVVFDPTVQGDDVISWDTFVQTGRRALPTLHEELATRDANLGPGDLATIMYTSGTTGNPKRVMLTHGNLVSNACVGSEMARHRPDDVVLSWLPYSHIYARTVDHYGGIAAGLTLALAESAETVVDNLRDIQPTHMA